jgi:hypothetical protein
MSDTVQFTATRLYKIGNNAPIYLTVTIGDNQVGGTSVIFDGQSIGPANGTIDKLQIGSSGDNLQFKLLLCTTNIKDINTETNQTSVTYTLTGGEEPQDFPFTIDTTQNGGLAMYSITFAFV